MTHTRDEIMAMSAKQLRIEIAKKKGQNFLIGVPDYPNDIAAAWVLFEELGNAERYPTINYSPSESDESLYYWVDFVNPCEEFRAEDTAPLAISRAWLIWSEESGK